MNKVTTGQKFKPKATTWNSFVDAAVYVKQRQSDLTSKALRRDTRSGIVLVRNSTEEDLGQFAGSSLGELIIKPEDNEPEFRANIPIFEAELITEENKDRPIVILQKPLKENHCGAAMLSGITPVKINVESEEHEFAEVDVKNGLKSSESGSMRVLWKEPETGGKWAIIQIGASTAGFIYEGYFAVTNVSEDETQKVKVSYGIAIINDSFFEVQEEEIEITEECNLYLKSTYASEAIEAPILETSSGLPDYETGIFKGLIANIKWDDENAKIKKITQQQFGVMYGIIWGDC